MTNIATRLSFGPGIDAAEQAEIREVLGQFQVRFPALLDTLYIKVEEVTSLSSNEIGASEKSYVCNTGTDTPNRDIIKLFDRSRYTRFKDSYRDVIAHEMAHLLFNEYRGAICANSQPARHRAAQELYETFRAIFEEGPLELVKTSDQHGVNGYRMKGFVSLIGFQKFKERYDRAEARLLGKDSAAYGKLVETRLTFDSNNLKAQVLGGDLLVDFHDVDPVEEDIVDTLRYHTLGQTYADDPIVRKKIAAIQKFARAAFGQATSKTVSSPQRPNRLNDL